MGLLHSSRIRWAVAVVLVVAPSGCDDGRATDVPPGSTAAPVPDADTYLVVLRTALPPSSGDDARPVVYVVPLAEHLELEVQAAVIAGLEATHDVRFVDALGAAIDDDLPGAPPRNGSTVLGLGIVSAEAPHIVRLERYHADDDVDATLLTLTVTSGGWAVEAIEQVAAEVLVDGA